MAKYYDEIVQQALEFDPLFNLIQNFNKEINKKKKKNKENIDEDKSKALSNPFTPPSSALFPFHQQSSIVSSPSILTQPIAQGSMWEQISKPSTPISNIFPPTSSVSTQVPPSIEPKEIIPKKVAYAGLKDEDVLRFLGVSDKTQTTKPRITQDEENRFWSVLKGEIDPYITRDDVQKQLSLLQLKQQAEESLSKGTRLAQPTGTDWLSSPDVDIEQIKQGIMAGELYLEPSDYVTKEIYINDPQKGVVKEKFTYPVGYKVYPIFPREIDGQPYNVPGLKPLYYIKGDKVRKVREGFITEGIKKTANILGLSDKDLDEVSLAIKGMLPFTNKDVISQTPYLPSNLADALIGISANLPWSYQTLTEPGGKAIPSGVYPIYKETQPLQKAINLSPFAFANYGAVGNVFQPLTQLPNVVFGGYPQESPTELGLGEKATEQEIKQLEEVAEKNGMKQMVMDIVGMIAGGRSKTFVKLLMASFGVQPWTVEMNRHWTHKMAESALNLGTFWAFGKYSPIKNKIINQKPITPVDILKTAGYNIGIAGGSEALRNYLFYPQISEEDALRTTKSVAYAIAGALLFEAYNLPGYIRTAKILKRLYKSPKNVPENLRNVVNEVKDEINNLKEQVVQEEEYTTQKKQKLDERLDAARNLKEQINESLKDLEEIKENVTPEEKRVIEAKEEILNSIKDLNDIFIENNFDVTKVRGAVENYLVGKIKDELSRPRLPAVEKLQLPSSFKERAIRNYFEKWDIPPSEKPIEALERYPEIPAELFKGPAEKIKEQVARMLPPKEIPKEELQLKEAKEFLKTQGISKEEIPDYMGLTGRDMQDIPSSIWKKAAKDVGFEPSNLVKKGDKYYLKESKEKTIEPQKISKALSTLPPAVKKATKKKETTPKVKQKTETSVTEAKEEIPSKVVEPQEKQKTPKFYPVKPLPEKGVEDIIKDIPQWIVEDIQEKGPINSRKAFVNRYKDRIEEIKSSIGIPLNRLVKKVIDYSNQLYGSTREEFSNPQKLAKRLPEILKEGVKLSRANIGEYIKQKYKIRVNRETIKEAIRLYKEDLAYKDLLRQIEERKKQREELEKEKQKKIWEGIKTSAAKREKEETIEEPPKIDKENYIKIGEKEYKVIGKEGEDIIFQEKGKKKKIKISENDLSADEYDQVMNVLKNKVYYFLIPVIAQASKHILPDNYDETIDALSYASLFGLFFPRIRYSFKPIKGEKTGEFNYEIDISKIKSENRKQAEINAMSVKKTLQGYSEIYKGLREILFDVYKTTKQKDLKKIVETDYDGKKYKQYRNIFEKKFKEVAINKFKEFVNEITKELGPEDKQTVENIFLKRYLAGGRPNKLELAEAVNELGKIDDKYNTDFFDYYSYIKTYDDVAKEALDLIDIPRQMLYHYIGNPFPQFIHKTKQGEVKRYYPNPAEIKAKLQEKPKDIKSLGEKGTASLMKEILDKVHKYSEIYDNPQKIASKLLSDYKKEYGDFTSVLIPPTDYIQWVINNNPYKAEKKPILPQEFEGIVDKTYAYLQKAFDYVAKLQKREVSPEVYQETLNLIYEDFLSSKNIEKRKDYSPEQLKALYEGDIEELRTKRTISEEKEFIKLDIARKILFDRLRSLTEMIFDEINIKFDAQDPVDKKTQKFLTLFSSIKALYKDEFKNLYDLSKSTISPDYFVFLKLDKISEREVNNVSELYDKLINLEKDLGRSVARRNPEYKKINEELQKGEERVKVLDKFFKEVEEYQLKNEGNPEGFLEDYKTLLKEWKNDNIIGDLIKTLPSVAVLKNYVKKQKSITKYFILEENPVLQELVKSLLENKISEQYGINEYFKDISLETLMNKLEEFEKNFKPFISQNFIINRMIKDGYSIPQVVEFLKLKYRQKKLSDTEIQEKVDEDLLKFFKSLLWNSAENYIEKAERNVYYWEKKLQEKKKIQEEIEEKIDTKVEEKEKIEKKVNKEEGLKFITSPTVREIIQKQIVEKLMNPKSTKDEIKEAIQTIHNLTSKLKGSPFNFYRDLAQSQISKRIATELFLYTLKNPGMSLINFYKHLPEYYEKAIKKYYRSLFQKPEPLKLSEDIKKAQKFEFDRLWIHPGVLLPAIGYFANQFIIPDENQELKRWVFGLSLLGGATAFGYQVYKNFKKFGKPFLILPYKINENINFTEIPYVNRTIMKVNNLNHPDVQEAIKKAQYYHKWANEFGKRNLVVQAVTNPLANDVFKKIKETEASFKEKLYKIHRRISDLSNYDDFILGLVSKVSINTQRDLYQYRVEYKKANKKYPQLEELEGIKKDLIEKNLIQSISQLGKTATKFIDKKYGSFDKFKEEFDKAYKEYRDLIREQTELEYRVRVSEKLGIPLEKQEEAYKEAEKSIKEIKQRIEGLNNYRKEQIAEIREKIKELTTIIKDFNKFLVNIGVKEGIKSPNWWVKYQQYYNLKAKRITNRILSANKMRSKINLLIKTIRDYQDEINGINQSYKNYVKKMKDKYKIYNNIKNLLSPESVERYLYKSENFIHWNPLWQRTFGDYGVKIQSVDIGPSGEIVGYKSHESSPIKAVFYDKKKSGAVYQAIKYLESNGYQRHQNYTNIFVKDLGNGQKDFVKIKEFNRKVLDVIKAEQKSINDNLNAILTQLTQAYLSMEKSKADWAGHLARVKKLRDKVLKKYYEIDDLKDLTEEVEADIPQEIFEKLDQIDNIFNDKSQLSQLITLLSNYKKRIPDKIYRDFIGYKVADNPKEEATLFRYGLAGYFQSLNSSGLKNAIIGKIKGDIDPLIIDFGLGETPFGEWIWSIKNSLLQKPSQLFAKGIAKINDKVFDFEKTINTALGIAMADVFLGNIRAAYKNLKYAYIAIPHNAILRGEKLSVLIPSFIKNFYKGYFDFMRTTKSYNKIYKINSDVPILYKDDPLKQKLFEKLWRAGFFTNSVFDIFSSLSSILKLKDLARLPSGAGDIIKIGLYKIGFALQKNSEIINKLNSFEINYEILRRKGITDYPTLTHELIKSLAQDVGFFEVFDIGETTRTFRETPILKEFTRMLMPAFLQNWNYFESLRLVYNGLKAKVKGKATPQDFELTRRGLKALGVLLLLNTILGGWRGFPIIGDFVKQIEDIAESVDKEKGLKDELKGIGKLEFKGREILRSFGFTNNEIQDIFLILNKGIDSYLTNRDLAVENLIIGPMMSPFIINFYQRFINNLGKMIKNGKIDTNLLPVGFKNIAEWVEMIMSGEKIAKGTYYLPSGRKVTFQDLAFGYLGQELKDEIAKRAQKRKEIDLFTFNGRLDFLRKSINEIVVGTGSTSREKALLETILTIDPELEYSQSVLDVALSSYMRNYSEALYHSQLLGKQFIEERKKRLSQFILESKGMKEIYGSPEAFDRFAKSFKANITNYYEMLAKYDALQIVYNLNDLEFEVGNAEYDGRRILDYPLEEQGFYYALQKLTSSRKVKEFEFEIEKTDIEEYGE